MAIVPLTSLLTGSSSPLLASGDVLVFVDISDTTQAATGSTVKATQTQFFAAINVPIVITSASANALAVGLTGATNSAFLVDASTALQVAGLKVTGAVTGGTVAVVTTDSGAATNLTVNAKGTGTIGIGSVSTGRVTITPVTTITGSLTLSAALVYGGVTLSNAVTGTGNMVLSAGPTLTGTIAGADMTLSGTLGVTGAATFSSTSAHTGAATFASTVAITGTTTAAAINASGAVATGALTVTGAASISSTLTVPVEILAGSATANNVIRVRAANGNYWFRGQNAADTLAWGIYTNGTGAVLDGATTIAALLTTVASATASAGLRLPHGTAPTTPVDGDMWTTTAGLFVRINGVSKTVTLT